MKNFYNKLCYAHYLDSAINLLLSFSIMYPCTWTWQFYYDLWLSWADLDLQECFCTKFM